MASWAMVTVPVFALLTLLCWNSPGLSVFLFWLLRPAYERLPLYILSRALFGDTPTLKEALRDAYGRLKAQLVAEHPTDRAAYTAGKAAFVQAALAR